MKTYGIEKVHDVEYDKLLRKRDTAEEKMNNEKEKLNNRYKYIQDKTIKKQQEQKDLMQELGREFGII